MALIERSKGRRENQSDSGYTRLFGIKELGQLFSRTHGASISAGTELEKLIWERVRKITNFDEFIFHTTDLMQADAKEDGVWVARKEQIKKSKTINCTYEPDFLIFNPKERKCYIVEVKDGDQFDTKKASGEHTTLHNFNFQVSSALPYSTEIRLCGFNATNKDELWQGLKRKFSKNELWTGRELCDILKINYDEIVRTRTNDQQSNLVYFVQELVKIKPIRNMIRKLLKKIPN